MSNAKQQEVSLTEAGQVAPIWAVCTHAGGRGECRNPCLCPRSGPQTGCDHLLSSGEARPVQGPSTLEDKPSLSPSLLVFAKNFHGYHSVSLPQLPCQILIFSPFYRRGNGGSKRGGG